MRVDMIQWRDSRALASSWETKASALRTPCQTITSVGMVLEDTDERVVLAQSVTPEDEDDGSQVDHVLAILKVCIVKRRRLAVLP